MSDATKYALITGATSGIGYELAKLFAKNGYHLIIVARSEEDLEAVSVELNQQFEIKVIKISTDLFDPQNALEIYQKVSSQNIQIDVLVNDAGQGQYGEFINTDINRQLDIIKLNVESVVALTYFFLKDMVARGNGKILNLASVASKLPGPFQSVYHGTKAFVLSFSEAINNEVKDKGVTVTSLLPGATNTDFFNKADMEDAKNVKGKELADPAKVAKDGYDALMSGVDKVVSGFKNKMQVVMSDILPDSIVADMVHNQQKPAEDGNK